MEKPTLDPEEWILSFSDVKRLYICMARKLIKWAFLGGIGTFFLFAGFAIKYRVEASFKQGVERNLTDGFLKEFMGGVGMIHQPQAASIMKSHQILKPVIERIGLQIVPSSSERMISKMVRRFQEGFKAEKGAPLPDLDSFRFSAVHYRGEKEARFHLLFSEEGKYTVYDGKRREVGVGLVGLEFMAEDLGLRFTLQKTPTDLKIGFAYPFEVQNWIGTARFLRKEIEIKNDKDNSSVIRIEMTGRDRHLATQIVNEVMLEYQAYLKREYDHVAKEQIAYLEEKQEKIVGEMDHLFEEEESYWKDNLSENGFAGLEQESQSLLAPYQQMHNQVLSIDVELSRLDQIKQQGEGWAIHEESPLSSVISQMTQKIHELKQQKDLIELSLYEPLPNHLDTRKLKEIRAERFSLENLMQEMDRGVISWAQGLSDPEEREDVAQYLENHARLLSMREKMVRNQLFHAPENFEEFEGIDLDSARHLLIEYNHNLDAAQRAMRHYDRLKKEIINPQFELPSLAGILKDPFCQKIIAEASEIELQLKDEKHHSEKEGERWKETLALHRKILLDHLNQLDQIEMLNADLIRQKMKSLQKVSLDCIHQQVSVLYTQIDDVLKERKGALILEKELLQRKMEEMRASLASILPEKWRFEKWLNVKSSMINKVMETVTEVAESKTISAHLHHVESKPLDLAIASIEPNPPHLFRKGFLGAFVLPALIFFLALIRQLIQGFPLSLERLKAFKLPVLGKITPFCDGAEIGSPSRSDLEILRKIALFSEGAKVIGLIQGKGPDYSYALAENGARRHAKSVIVQCDFLSSYSKERGILQFCQEEMAELPIQKRREFDLLSTGGYTPFGTEIIQSHRFRILIEQLKEKYDSIFLVFRSSLSSAESESALQICEKAIVTVFNEQTEELTPFVHWGYDENHCRLMFITYT